MSDQVNPENIIPKPIAKTLETNGTMPVSIRSVQANPESIAQKPIAQSIMTDQVNPENIIHKPIAQSIMSDQVNPEKIIHKPIAQTLENNETMPVSIATEIIHQVPKLKVRRSRLKKRQLKKGSQCCPLWKKVMKIPRIQQRSWWKTSSDSSPHSSMLSSISSTVHPD